MAEPSVQRVKSTTLTNRNREKPAMPPDPAALAIARAAHGSVHYSAVILFGSRAAGTHRPDSDVDLMLVSPKSPIAEHSRANRAIAKHMADNPPPLRVEIVPMSMEEFNYCRRAKNHVAGQAFRKGIIMGNERLDFSGNYEDKYPDNWPDIRDHLAATHRFLGAFQREYDHPDGAQEIWAFHGQQAVENALKGWISAAGLEYSGVHDLESIGKSVLEDETESRTLAAAQLRILLDYSTVPDPGEPEQTVNWLSRYGAWYRYHSSSYSMNDNEKTEFADQIIMAALTFMNRAQEISGTTDDDLRQ